MRFLLLAALAGFAIDQGSKYLVMFGLDLLERGVIDVAPPFLRFVMGWNRGMNFGFFASHEEAARWFLIGISVVIVIGLSIWAARKDEKWVQIGAGLIVGGALGNVLDRLRYGAVADFLNMSCCGIDNPYIFNLADVVIFGGAALMILMGGEKQQTRRR